MRPWSLKFGFWAGARHRGCACLEAAEVTAQFALEQGEPRVWWHATWGLSFQRSQRGTALWRLRSWSRQRRLLTAPHGQGRGLPLGNALAFAGELDQEEFEGGDTRTVKNDSPSQRWIPLGCAS